MALIETWCPCGARICRGCEVKLAATIQDPAAKLNEMSNARKCLGRSVQVATEQVGQRARSMAVSQVVGRANGEVANPEGCMLNNRVI
jgi:hypothetical protein